MKDSQRVHGNFLGGGGEKRKSEGNSEGEEWVPVKGLDTGTSKLIATFDRITKPMMEFLPNMSGLYYLLQGAMLFWFNEVESLKLALNDMIERKAKLESGEIDVANGSEGLDVDYEKNEKLKKEELKKEELKNLGNSIPKMEEMQNAKNNDYDSKISDFVNRYNMTINNAKVYITQLKQQQAQLQAFGGQKKKNKDIEIKKCGKEKKVEAKEKEKLKEKENEKIKKEKLKEKLKKEKEKEKIKKEKLKEKLKKEKEKEKIKKEKLKEKKKETKQKMVKKETKQNKKK
jgi:hypothetical protein